MYDSSILVSVMLLITFIVMLRNYLLSNKVQPNYVLPKA